MSLQPRTVLLLGAVILFPVPPMPVKRLGMAFFSACTTNMLSGATGNPRSNGRAPTPTAKSLRTWN